MAQSNIFPTRSWNSSPMAGGSALQSPTAASPGLRSAARLATRSAPYRSATPAFPRCGASSGRGPSRSNSQKGRQLFSKLLNASLIAALMAGTASADTLREALVSTYATNPTLTGQRETLKATDATVAIARAAGRPQVSATVGLNRTLTQSGLLINGGKGPTVSAGVDLSYPLFQGGAVKNSVRAAETRVEAGRATLQAVEGDVFTQAVTAYMDVIRDRAIVELNQNNVKVLETNLQATQDRFQIGDLTRTDVAQSEARLQLGRSQLATAQGQLTGSEATYRQAIGHPPRDLGTAPTLPPLAHTE